MFNIRPSTKIVATILMKNEEDIIAANIEHHIQQGVSQFIITDNNSSDKSRSIAEKYPEVVEIIDEPENTHNQTKWVTRMAQMACKLSPDWIVHLDADEFWCGLMGLREVQAKVAGCERMYLHPPGGEMTHYLDFDRISIPQECKIAHRPDPTFVITHGNHGVENCDDIEFTKKVYRHHYPVRSYEQWARKARGHEALSSRRSICARWEKWYNLLQEGMLEKEYQKLTSLWEEMIRSPQHDKFLDILDFWATPEMITFFKNNPELPRIGEWRIK
jgi:glycosyltransferase involved in cell wall biosynthesis